MKLSKINVSNLNDTKISTIVFDNIYDNKNNCDIAIVFGNFNMINERTLKATEMYNKKRVSKLLFTGGLNGESSNTNETISEAEKMGKLAINLGIPSKDILVETNSNNTFENVQNSIDIIKNKFNINNIQNIMLITSDYHLKRCLAIFKLYLPNKNYTLVDVKNGYSDKENWFNSELKYGTGRGIVTFEANILVKYAKNNQIFDLDINL